QHAPAHCSRKAPAGEEFRMACCTRRTAPPAASFLPYSSTLEENDSLDRDEMNRPGPCQRFHCGRRWCKREHCSHPWSDPPSRKVARCRPPEAVHAVLEQSPCWCALQNLDRCSQLQHGHRNKPG